MEIYHFTPSTFIPNKRNQHTKWITHTFRQIHHFQLKRSKKKKVSNSLCNQYITPNS